MRMWNDSKSPSVGCIGAVSLAGLSLLGFLTFPQMGLFAPIAMGITLFGAVYLTQLFWRWYYGYEKGMYPIENNKFVHFKEDRFVLMEEKETIYYKTITNYRKSYNFFTVYYTKGGKEESQFIQFWNLQNVHNFYNHFDSEYKKFKENENDIPL